MITEIKMALLINILSNRMEEDGKNGIMVSLSVLYSTGHITPASDDMGDGYQ